MIAGTSSPQPKPLHWLLLPIGLVLGGAWFWPVACLMVVLAAMEGEIAAMLLWYGVTLGCDPQALLLAPFVIAVAIERRVGGVSLVVTVLAIAGTMLVRSLIGDAPVPPPFPLDLPLSRGAPNVWVLLHALPGLRDLPLIGLAFATTAGAAAAFAAWFSARRLYRHTIPDAVLLCALVMAVVMPGADLGVLTIADVVALTLALDARHDPARWQVAGLVLGGGALALFGGPDAAPFAALWVIVAAMLQANAVLSPAANDNPLMPHTA